MNIHIYLHVDSDSAPIHIGAKLETIQASLDMIQQELKKMATNLDALTAQVKANTDVEASAVVLIQGIAAKLEAAKTDPVAIQALADQLKGSATALGDAITANTPAA